MLVQFSKLYIYQFIQHTPHCSQLLILQRQQITSEKEQEHISKKDKGMMQRTIRATLAESILLHTILCVGGGLQSSNCKLSLFFCGFIMASAKKQCLILMVLQYLLGECVSFKLHYLLWSKS